ncbi:MAG: hypothetical protein ABFS21_02970 [Actinomycetota bacterium]
MTSELKQRLEQMADRGEWRGADTIMTAARTGADQPLAAPSPMTRQRYGWAVALGAAALVLVLIGGVAWWSAVTQHDEPVVDEPVTTTIPEVAPTTAPVTPVPTTTPEAAPTTIAETTTLAPPVSPLSWTPIQDEEVFSDTALSNVASGGPGLIAIGVADADPAYEGVWPVLAVWLSEDGTTWERIDDPTFSGDPSAGCAGDPWIETHNMAVGPLGIIIVGADTCDGAAWISQDGRSWTEVIPDGWRGNPVAAWGVVAGGPGWVVAGNDGHGNGTVWVSADGIEWAASGDEDFLAEEGGRIDLGEVAVLGQDLVVLGTGGFSDWSSSRQTDESPGPHALVWVSSDGLEWERLPADTIPHEGQVGFLGTEPSGERLVGFSIPTLTVPDWKLWTSTDATTWTSMALPDDPGMSVIWEGDTIVTATGFLSTDGGATWIDTGEDIPGPSRAFLPPAITLSGDRFIIGGYERGVMARAGWGEPGGSISTVWIGEWIEEEGS